MVCNSRLLLAFILLSFWVIAKAQGAFNGAETNWLSQLLKKGLRVKMTNV